MCHAHEVVMEDVVSTGADGKQDSKIFQSWQSLGGKSEECKLFCLEKFMQRNGHFQIRHYGRGGEKHLSLEELGGWRLSCEERL